MSNFLGVMSVNNTNSYCLQRPNTRKFIGQRRGVAIAGDTQVPPHTPADGVAMLVSPAGLTDSKVRAS